MSSNPCNHKVYGGGDHLTADQGCVWPFDRRFKGPWPRGLRLYGLYSLYARSVCDTTAPLQQQLSFVVLCKCYAFTFLSFLAKPLTTTSRCLSSKSVFRAPLKPLRYRLASTTARQRHDTRPTARGGGLTSQPDGRRKGADNRK